MTASAALVLLPVLMQAQTQVSPEAPTQQAQAPGSLDVNHLRRLIDGGHPDAALAELDKLPPEQRGSGAAQRLRGLALYGQGKLQEADGAFAAALAADPADSESAQMRGLTLFRLGRPKDAIPLLEGAHSWSAGTKFDPSYVLALCYIDTRRYDDARRAFAAQYGLPPESAAAYLLAARMLLRRDYLPVAREFGAKAVELDPRLPLAHALLGEIELAGNHLDAAIAEFELERSRNPLDGSVYDRLGDAYSRAGRYTEAQQSLQRAVLLEPNSTGPFILLGKVLLKRQDPVGAMTYLGRAESMDPANYMTHSLLAQAYRSLGRTEEASRELATAERLQHADEPKLESPK